MNLITKTEKITFGEKKIFGIFKKNIKFNVVADIPDDMLDDYAIMAKFNEMEINPEEQKKAFQLMKKVIISLLSIANNQKKVEKFVFSLGIKATNKIFIFLNEYINEADNEKKND